MSKRTHNKGGGAQGINLSLIITPMLDMSFQLLAFFIMTYHPSALEGHIPGSLVPPEDFAKKGLKFEFDETTRCPQTGGPLLTHQMTVMPNTSARLRTRLLCLN